MLKSNTSEATDWGFTNMITYLDISLFESPAQTLVNTVNTVGVMGKGIAAIFKKLYPEMFEKYRQLCDQRKLDIGKLYVYRTANKIIVNFPTKKHWRNPSHIDYIEAGLSKFVSSYQDYGISSASFPQLGCGHGELDWENQVQPIMEQYLQKLPIPVYIHIYTKSPDFIPERFDTEFVRQIRLERQQISANQVWCDLQKLVSNNDNEPYHMDLFTTVTMDEEHIIFTFFGNEPVVVYRQDIEDLWSILRLRGTLREEDFPQPIKDTPAASSLLDLLKRLDYIKPISLGVRNGQGFHRTQGLQYVPLPNEDISTESEIVI